MRKNMFWVLFETLFMTVLLVSTAIVISEILRVIGEWLKGVWL
jgi:hypothetical protein